MASLPEAATEQPRSASAAGKTDVGRRRDHNEDQVLVSPELSLYAVADGMGGHQAGDVASSITAAALEEFFWEEQDLGDDIEGLDDLPSGAVRLVKAIHHSNREVFSRSGRSANQGGMGSTVVAMHIDEEAEAIHIAHVGDSRCYRIRDGAIELLTQDHSMINEALRLNPDLSPEILRQLPSNVVTRALGTKENVQPDVCTEAFRKGDIYLLCSDGLSGEVADEDLLFGVLESENLEDGCDLLVAMANEAGGRDNVSAVLVRVERDPSRPAAEPDQPRLVAHDDEVDVDVHDDDQLDDADLDAWLAQPSDEEVAASEPPPATVSDEERDEIDLRFMVEDDVPLDDDESAGHHDADAVATEHDDEDEAPAGDASYDEGPYDDDRDEREDDDFDDQGDQDDQDDEDFEDEEPAYQEGLAALAPPFGNEPPRLRRPPPREPLPTRPATSQAKQPIAALPVMGIGEMTEPPPEPEERRRRCHHCGHRLLPEERFCGMCGERTIDEGELDPSLPLCDACGTVIVDDTRFCVECGVRL